MIELLLKGGHIRGCGEVKPPEKFGLRQLADSQHPGRSDLEISVIYHFLTNGTDLKDF